jgi:hypothetical protein
MPCRRNLVIGLLLSRLQVFWKWARRDSNPRPTDYESAEHHARIEPVFRANKPDMALERMGQTRLVSAHFGRV